MSSVLAPLNIGPLCSPAGDMVAQTRGVLVGSHPQPDHSRTVRIDDDSLDSGYYVVARERVLPCLESRMAHLGLDQVHFAHPPLVLLKGRDFFGIGSTHQ